MARIVSPGLYSSGSCTLSRGHCHECRPLSAAVQAGSASLPVRAPAELASAAQAILGQVDHELGSFFDLLYHRGYIDLGSRPERLRVNEEWFFPETGLPFLLLEADLLTLLHEFGHGYHNYLSLVIYTKM